MLSGLLASGFVGLVNEALAKVNPAQGVLVIDGHFIELLIGARVLNVSLHQGRAKLNILDQHLFLSDGFFDERGLLGSELMRRLVLGFLLLGVRACHTHRNEQEKEGDLPKRHVKLLGKFFQVIPAPTVPLRLG